MIHPTIPSRRVTPLGAAGSPARDRRPDAASRRAVRRAGSAAACRAALNALERAGAVCDADRTLREIAAALHPRLDVTTAGRTNRAPAICDAPNCVGHRVRA